ncbi:MAG TPA: hypothetical protein VGX25_17115 [Actinophytocola sp.]|uniref:hypothetical protein n=1 Tax=Actinophytocola sp. TaxID=1872138 RepID=UPI002DDCA17E|nr:hypothetical protein [Actinophytocola sp.]HEV2781107.1 hypothetical protein [Actinophytocola sp.]
MYVFEGLKGEDEPDFQVPVHYFHFQNFRPEVMRLKQDDYFEYVELPADTKKIMRGHQAKATVVYRHYLSYDGLLTCLELNELVDRAVITRIEAHYTFLGQFLHPTNDAARQLHEDCMVLSVRCDRVSPRQPTAPCSVGRLVFVRSDRTRSPAREADILASLPPLAVAKAQVQVVSFATCCATTTLPVGGPPTAGDPSRERVSDPRCGAIMVTVTERPEMLR